MWFLEAEAPGLDDEDDPEIHGAGLKFMSLTVSNDDGKSSL